MKAIPIKVKLIIFLTGFAVFLSIKNQDPLFLATILIALAGATITDLAFAYLRKQKFVFSDSSVISALIISFVLASDNPWWIFLFASFCAIASKQLIRFQKKHIFNPAALGIFISVVLLGANTQWKGTYLWPVLLPVGLYLSYTIRKLELLAGYFITALTLFGMQAVLNKVAISGIFGYLSYFYIFIMIVEPKTTPVRPLGKLIFGSGIAALIFVLTQVGVRFDVELASLLVFNLLVFLLNKLP